ncbi:hypothetical protein VTK73DRAFT_1041 [Phialemonium thermophilum]|uniref:Poly(A) polymerase n=1 Tax=Phialemonium thermophilum TaxID=223376 RepID=A0ABR3XB21_9PEZI
MKRLLELNARETQLKNLLLDVTARLGDSPGGAFGPNGTAREPVMLRWAGGWVRDKLLGIDSHDIDVAINTMTGEAFASRLRDICDLPEVRDRHHIGRDDVGHLHKIAKNPEKSKHLETTTTKLFGLDVDFVNLRKESYTDDSRNPQVEFGTAEEDALRRDATVNALFYNIHTDMVEDFTGGLADLEAKVIRTPMEPLHTFTDDPLRVLRLVRFASRLQFSLHPDTRCCMADPRVLDALRVKISRERVGVEVEKMLKGNHPRDSLKLIDELGLYHTIFTDPNWEDMPRPDTNNWRSAYECLQLLADDGVSKSIYDLLVGPGELERYFAWVLAAVVPWEQLPDEKPLKPGKPAPPLPTTAVREGIKANNKLSDVITAAHENRPSILQLKSLVDAEDQRSQERDRFGMAIRAWDARGGYWRLQVLYALLFDILKRTSPDTHIRDRDKIILEWRRFIDRLQALDVMDAPSLKRILDGRQLAQAMGVKPGRWMSGALEVVMAWQLRNPGVNDPSGAVEEVKRRKDELGIS